MIEYNLPPSSNWLRPTTYTREALDLGAMLVRIQPEVRFIALIAQPDRATDF